MLPPQKCKESSKDAQCREATANFPEPEEEVKCANRPSDLDMLRPPFPQALSSPSKLSHKVEHTYTHTYT